MGTGNPFPDDVNEQNQIDQALFINQLSSGRTALPAQSQKAGHETWSCAWSPDGAYFAWSCGNKIVKLVPWSSVDISGGEGNKITNQPYTLNCKELVWALAFGSSLSETHPHSTSRSAWWRYKMGTSLVLATGLQSGRIRTWDVKTGKILLELVDHREVIRDLKFAPDGSMRLVSASRDGCLKVWDLEDDGNMSHTLRGISKWLYACAWSPDAKMLASVGDSRAVLLWDMDSYKRIRKLEGHHHDVVSCDFSPDGAMLATSSYDTRVILWDPHTGQILKTLGHLFPPPSPIFAGGANESYVRAVSFSHDGVHIASVADDSYVRFWNVFHPHCPEKIAVVNNSLCCSYSPDGFILAVGDRNGNVSFWLSPMKVSSLQHLCRIALRRIMPSTKVDSLLLPVRLKSFLKYCD